MNSTRTLYDEKMTKIKKFAQGYIRKALHLLEKGKRVRRSRSTLNTTTPSLHFSPSTPPQQGEKKGNVEMDIER